MKERFGRGMVMSWRENNIKNEEQGEEEEVEDGIRKATFGSASACVLCDETTFYMSSHINRHNVLISEDDYPFWNIYATHQRQVECLVVIHFSIGHFQQVDLLTHGRTAGPSKN
ncbi:hypothetical protein J6590_032971 [Homalodisca vitripennis]|nr:hypothetical protein J6590_032971 [Homalodisca vitripennis]